MKCVLAQEDDTMRDINGFQTGAGKKCVRGDSGHGAGEFDGLQRNTLRKGAVAKKLEAVGYICMEQFGAVKESTVAHAAVIDPRRDQDLLQGSAVCECIGRDVSDWRQGGLGQGVTGCKHPLSQMDYRRRHSDLRKGVAVGKSAFLDFDQTVREYDRAEVFAAQKRAALNVFHTFRENDGCNRLAGKGVAGDGGNAVRNMYNSVAGKVIKNIVFDGECLMHGGSPFGGEVSADVGLKYP